MTTLWISSRRRQTLGGCSGGLLTHSSYTTRLDTTTDKGSLAHVGASLSPISFGVVGVTTPPIGIQSMPREPKRKSTPAVSYLGTCQIAFWVRAIDPGTDAPWESPTARLLDHHYSLA